MDLIKLHACLADTTRLRLLGLLRGGPLCVCHLQEILGEPQVKVSKHLATLKAAGLVEARREANWMIYSLPSPVPAPLAANLALLDEHGPEEIAADAEGLARLRRAMPAGSPACTLKKPAGRGVLKTTAVKTAGRLKLSR